MKKITIQDVAKELNLSRNTVAKALNNSDTVSYETRYLVIEKAYEMGYAKLSPEVLNEFKPKNKMPDPQTVVVLNRREISVFWNNILMGVSDALNKFGCKLQLSFVNETEEQNLVIPMNIQEEVGGIIILSAFSKEYVDRIMEYNIPVIFLDAPADINSISDYGDIIISEGDKSVEKITRHLIEQGARKIGFIGDITYSKTISDRFLGYRRGLEKAGMEPDPGLIVSGHTPWRYYTLQEVTKAIKSFSYMPEAIVCANDDIALYAIRYLNSIGIRVPEDVAITGYDNLESMSQGEPMLTTVRVGNQRLGKRLVQQLMWRLEHPKFPKEVVYIGTEVIFRKSSNRSGEKDLDMA